LNFEDAKVPLSRAHHHLFAAKKRRRRCKILCVRRLRMLLKTGGFSDRKILFLKYRKHLHRARQNGRFLVAI